MRAMGGSLNEWESGVDYTTHALQAWYFALTIRVFMLRVRSYKRQSQSLHKLYEDNRVRKGQRMGPFWSSPGLPLPTTSPLCPTCNSHSSTLEFWTAGLARLI